MGETKQLEFCTAEKDGRILTVTINRPERMNALHWMANEELSTAGCLATSSWATGF